MLGAIPAITLISEDGARLVLAPVIVLLLLLSVATTWWHDLHELILVGLVLNPPI
jgi:hypothetical protein